MLDLLNLVKKGADGVYISANLPARYGVFESIRKDNFPFNQTFAQYVELIAHIGMHHALDIIEVIGFIEDGIMGEERLPDIPEGDTPVQFRFKTHSDDIQTYYQEQEMTNRQITMLIIMMTLRLSERYGTSLYRITSKIRAISGLADTPTQPKRKAKPVQKPTPVVADKPKPKIKIKKRKRIVPEEPEEVVPEADVPEEVEEAEVEVAPEATEEDEDDIVARLQKLTKQGETLLGEKDEDAEEVVVETNPALGDFFSQD